jgi:hypothetical protein
MIQLLRVPSLKSESCLTIMNYGTPRDAAKLELFIQQTFFRGGFVEHPNLTYVE